MSFLLNPHRFAAAAAPAQWIGHFSDPANLAVYTFGGIALPAGRAVIMARSQAGAGVTLGAITIHGVTAGIDFDASFNANNPTVFASAIIPAGTGSVVGNLTGGTSNRTAIGVWGVGGRSFVTGVNDNTASPAILDRNTNAGDVALATAYVFGAGVTYTPTGLLERFDGQIEGSNHHTVCDNLNCLGGAPEQFRIAASAGTPNGALALYR